ncbi:MAG: hypothetical protein R8J84_06515 [Mariprofundales bacterium]
MLALLFSALLVACAAHQLPLQMMAEARSAIQAAHDLTPAPDSSAGRKLAQADGILRGAAHALDQKHYDDAGAKAKQARDLARAAIHLTPAQESSHPN